MSDNDRLAPGDLAIIIKSIDSMSIGKIVECVKIDGTHSLYGTIWLIRSPRADLVSEYGGVGHTAHAAQDWLRKIPSDPLPEETDELVLDLETS